MIGGTAKGVWGPAGFGGGSLGGGGQPKATLDGKGFAEMPQELHDGIAKVLAMEPTWEEPDIAFTHQMGDRRPLAVRRLLGLSRLAIIGLGAVIVVETVSLQAGPALIQVGLDGGVLDHQAGVLIAAGLASILAVLVTVVASSVRGAWTGRIAASAMFRLRLRVFTHLQRLSMDYYTNEKAGVILTRMMSDIEQLQTLLQDGYSQFAIQLLTMVIVSTVLFSYNVELALITVFIVVPALLVLSAWFRRASDRGYLRVRNGIAGVLSDLSETLQGIRVIAGYNRQHANLVHHRNVVGTYREANDYTARIAGFYAPTTEFIGLIGQVLILFIGGKMVIDGELSVGELTAFVLYIAAFFQPIQQLVQTYNMYQAGKAALVKLRELLATDPSVVESPDAYPLPPVAGNIVFEGITFGYDGAIPVIHDVDLQISPGETVAFVGPTGAGKSTLAKLVPRFYDPTAGRILIDGHDLRRVRLKSLRRQLGVVPQEPFLFAGSIRDNVAFARPSATDDELDEAIDLVGLRELIDSLPAGWHTPVHERGVSLSAGERQLIALARTFVARPRVLVLDEATSNLDLRSERKVEAALDKILEGRTAIIVAHRLTTAMRADRVVVIDRGQVVEQGTHDELVSRGGSYASMYEVWAEHSLHDVVAGPDGALNKLEV
jgi:ATP-binding cassette, subfamily B, bacterial